MKTASPIFVTGMPRSGTTFVQHLLSRHPEIQISGQEPSSLTWGDWLQTAVNGVVSANASNDQLVDYEVPHYATPHSSQEAASRFLNYVRWYLTGGARVERWGAKSLTQCRVAPDTVLDVWPETRWIVCIRDPFRSIESLRNTFDAEQKFELQLAVQWWIEAVRFAHSHAAALPVLFDRLTETSERSHFVNQLFGFIGEEVAAEVSEFAARWPVVHKVVQDQDRRYALSETDRESMLNGDSEFRSWVERLGYLSAEVAAS